jgi:hypothetical protein
MLSDIFNGFMAIPNLIALILLNKAVTRESDDYTQNIYNLERFNISQAYHKRTASISVNQEFDYDSDISSPL